MQFDPLGVVAGGGVVRRPKGHAVVLLDPQEEASSEHQAQDEWKAYGEPRMPANQIAQSDACQGKVDEAKPKKKQTTTIMRDINLHIVVNALQ